MPRSTNAARRPRRKQGQTLERRSPPTHADRAWGGAAPDDAAAPRPPLALAREPAPSVNAGYHLLAATTENAKQAVEANALRLSVELVGLQRKAINSVHEAAISTLQLAEAVSRASGPAQAADAYLEHSRNGAAALNGVAIEFFRSALGLIGALALTGVGATFDHPFAVARDDIEADALARRVAALTVQQRRVLHLIVKGLPNKLIAYELGICETTVKAHVSQVLMKFNVYSRARIIALLGRYGGFEGLN